MRRLASILLLVAIALPYARTPICSTAGHEHDDHQHRSAVSVTAHDSHGETTSDCHRLMACDTSVTGLTSLAGAHEKIRVGYASRTLALAPRHDGPTRAPIPPPPQTV